MARSFLGLIVILLALMPCAARSASEALRTTTVADWEISEFSASCFGRASSMTSGATMLFFGVAQHGITAFVSNPKWRMTPNGKGQTVIHIDERSIGRYGTRTFDETTVEIDIPRSVVPKLQAGDLVRMQFERASYTFPLKYSRKGFAALEECFTAKTGPGSIPPSERAQPKDNKASLSAGSGFFVDGVGHIITNNHVVDGCTAVHVARYGLARIIRRDPPNDLALVAVDAAPKSYAKFRQHDLEQAQKILAFGYPLVDLLGGSMNVTSGIVSSLTGLDGDTRYVQISAPIQPGNSGGPLVDERGHIAGVVTSKMDARALERKTGAVPENVAWASRISLVENFLKISGVQYEVGTETASKLDQEIAKDADRFTVLIGCVR